MINLRGPEYRRDDTQTEGTYKDATGTHPASKTRWYVYDGLGSVVGEVDPAGNLTASAKYDVYGAKRIGTTGTATSKQGFVGGLGHVTDSETGLVYMRARYYDPTAGRFISQDSKQSGNNWFAYCDNNPVNKLDRSGQDTFDANWWTNVGFSMEQAGAGLITTGLGTVYAGDAMFNTGTWMREFGAAGGPLCGAALAEPAAMMQMNGALTMFGGLGQIILGAEMIQEGYYIENNPDEFAQDSTNLLNEI